MSCIASWEAEECIRTHAHYASLHGDDGKLQIRAETRHGRAQTTSLCCVVSATMCHTYGLRPPRGSTLAMRGVSTLFDTSRACGSPRPPREETLKAAVCRSYMVAHGAVSTAGPRPRCRQQLLVVIKQCVRIERQYGDDCSAHGQGRDGLAVVRCPHVATAVPTAITCCNQAMYTD